MKMASVSVRSPKHALAAAFLFASLPAGAQEIMTADAAREFVVGRFFTYQCFDGTYGSGRIEGDGSAAGTIRVNGSGLSHYLRLPENTLYVLGNQVCAKLRGLPFEPCFNLVKTGPDSFRGSLSQMNFMYCNFERKGGVTQLVRRRGTTEKTSHRKLDKPTELKPDTKAASTKPASETKAIETKPVSDVKSAGEAKPAEAKPAETKPAEVKVEKPAEQEAGGDMKLRH
jgi:hypothetical protein